MKSLSEKQVLAFQRDVLIWFKKQGRKDLPWQKNKSPYRIWISEIMLQQTQVKTVIPYFERFIEKFPTLESLAQASLDEVLKLWSGLGYYTRARNLHRCAQIIISDYHGQFPKDLEYLQQLPGIGRSTAGAILSLGLKKRAIILDGNVQRVLSRYAAIEGNLNSSSSKNKLWHLGETYTPQKQHDAYNQAMMDLGALICTRRNPICQQCPLMRKCLARLQNRVEDFPYTKRTKKLPIRSVYFLLMSDARGRWLLQKRPPIGVWGGLFSFPQCSTLEKLELLCRQHFSVSVSKKQTQLPSFRHTFSHFHFDITPLRLKVENRLNSIMEMPDIIWYDPKKPFPYGLPQPVKKLLEQLTV